MKSRQLASITRKWRGSGKGGENDADMDSGQAAGQARKGSVQSADKIHIRSTGEISLSVL